MTRTVLWLLALVAVSTADSEGRKSYSRYKILSVRASNAAQVDYLNQLQSEDISGLSFFQVPSLDRDIDILVPPVHVNRIKKSLKKQAMKPEVVVEDMQSLIDEESRAMRSVRNSYDIRNNYLTYNKIVDWLRTVNSSYPTVQLSDIGRSVEDRSIYKVKVASNIADTKPAIWIECLSHAREWITGAVCLGVIDMLTNPEYEAQRGVMLDKFDWHIAPVVNPDGYVYTHDKDRLWRKNRSKAVRGCQGVDLNRNWDISFGGAGTSSYSCSDVYHGPGPISEPENQVLNKAVLETESVQAFFSMHSYSQLLLLPYAYSRSATPDDFDDLKAVADEAMEELKNVNGKQFTVGHTASLLYEASGGTFDYFKYGGKAKYSYVYELRPGGSQGYQGFILDETEIEPSIMETFASLKSFAEQIAVREKL